MMFWIRFVLIWVEEIGSLLGSFYQQVHGLNPIP